VLEIEKEIKLIINSEIYLPDQTISNGWLLVNGKFIENFSSGVFPETIDSSAIQIIDGSGLKLLPGFIDTHVHGAVGFETMDHSIDGLYQMSHFYALHGVTSFLPTTWSAQPSKLLPVLETIKTLKGRTPNGATILGAHLEGPFINPKKAGAQNQKNIFSPAPENFSPLLNLDIIRLITIAPEIENSEWLIKTCLQNNITVSAGHTNADYKTMKHAFDLGIRQTTHTFNAMTGLHHREPGGVGAALTDNRISCELIADNIHLHPAVLDLAYRAKTRDKIILVTDAILGTGLPDGNYPIGDRYITITDGIARIPEGNLAGSTLTMDHAIRNLINATGKTLAEVLPTATINPARAIGVANHKGSIERNKDADLILMDETLKIVLTIVEGKCITP